MKNLLTFILISIAVGANAQTEVEAIFIKKINDFRKGSGLNEVKYNSILDSAAEFHSTYMKQVAKAEHYQTDYATPQTRIAKFDTKKQFDNSIIGENVLSFCLYGDTLTDEEIAAQCFKQWFESPPHRALMLMPDAKTIGFGSVIIQTIQNPFPQKFNYGWCTIVLSGPQVQRILTD